MALMTMPLSLSDGCSVYEDRMREDEKKLHSAAE